MDLITNPKLKEMLLSWGSKMKDFEHAETSMSTNLNRNVMPKMEKLIALRNPENFGNIKGLKGSSIQSDNRTVLSNLEAENVFFNHLWELENVAGLYPSLSNSIESILEELQK